MHVLMNVFKSLYAAASPVNIEHCSTSMQVVSCHVRREVLRRLRVFVRRGAVEALGVALSACRTLKLEAVEHVSDSLSRSTASSSGTCTEPTSAMLLECSSDVVV